MSEPISGTPQIGRLVCDCGLDLGPKPGDMLSVVLAAMRKDGQGLSHDQEQTIRRGLGLTLL